MLSLYKQHSNQDFKVLSLENFLILEFFYLWSIISSVQILVISKKVYQFKTVIQYQRITLKVIQQLIFYLIYLYLQTIFISLQEIDEGCQCLFNFLKMTEQQLQFGKQKSFFIQILHNNNQFLFLNYCLLYYLQPICLPVFGFIQRQKNHSLGLLNKIMKTKIGFLSIQLHIIFLQSLLLQQDMEMFFQQQHMNILCIVTMLIS
ncbi:hypothetical protein IMG5_010860 [Ichthyophthirius multifiliis]|uniref:Transmembrane protein n=1 Tax=Ichthyophthirius multifiliis TaxID=5932 RepID=G0QJZ9_ICHMU|nr:hypothetical protein IMG5_010860 [Ichthyophthirius multifiliis]EGR34459.1 hypothetical protein IMG5_010860 [Ichthyophthirius multifiliis]|eukprot:XP_004039763.1 hypothetical protein IMG5_010860 [Ichthyophthirius multifiliis]